MHYYASETAGIGGVLRSTAEDFRVDEIPVDVGNEGPYLICRLEKKDWELQHAVKETRKKARDQSPEDRVGRDKRPPCGDEPVDLPLQCNAGPGRQRQAEGYHARSTRPFTTCTLPRQPEREQVRDRDQGSGRFDIAAQVTSVTRTAAEGLPNYYGIQRFGVIRPLTHRIGEYILRQDFESAVTTYIGKAFPDEPEEIRAARDSFLLDRDPAAALHNLPVPMSYNVPCSITLSVTPEIIQGHCRSCRPSSSRCLSVLSSRTCSIAPFQ